MHLSQRRTPQGRALRRRAPQKSTAGRRLLVSVALLLAACDAPESRGPASTAPPASPPAASQPAPSQPPARIILVVIDTLRRDHVDSGSDVVSTPNLDALAERGQRLDPVVASFHQTTMSMAALFTGRTPSLESEEGTASLEWNGRNWCGMRRFAADGEDACIPAALPTLAEALAERGYWTAGVATNPLIFRPEGYDRGFDTWIEVRDDDDSADGRSGEAANRAVEALLASRPSDRFFLYVHLMDAHDYQLEERGYRDSVALADRALGDLVATLDGQGLLDDAFLLVTADHGERLDDRHVVRGTTSHHGNPSFEEVLRIPLLMVPAFFPEGIPGVLRGEDLNRLIKRVAGIQDLGPHDLEPGELFVSETRYQTYRLGRWKAYRPRGGELVLVDLQADPGEQRDVAAEHPDVVESIQKRMDELSTSLAAKGEVAPPTGLSEEDKRRLQAVGYLE